MLRSLFLILCFPSFYANAMTFSEAISKIQEHDSVEALISLAQAQYSDAESRGSWGDPSFKIAVKNLPQESLKDDETPMSGVEFSLSQKVPLTTKYGNLKKSYQAKAKSIEFDVKDQKQLLAKSLWQILIYKRSVLSEITIFKENIIWINKMIDISKKLYANGKLSQKALLDLQIRQTEIESEINNKKFELLKISDNLKYLLSQKKIDDKSVPWQILEQKDGRHLDHREKSLKEKVVASEFRLKAAKQNYIPDLTLSVGITKRSNIDDQGDFLGASISFPLPISDDKYGMQKKEVFEKYSNEKRLSDYKNLKERNISILEKEIQRNIKELDILKNKTVKFAMSSQQIVSKSYALGNSSYLELLQSELKLQSLQQQRISLEEKLLLSKVDIKYLRGESLNE